MIRIAALICGLICGIGLYIAGLFQPSVSLGFINPGAAWNPTLGIGLLAVLIVSGIGFLLTQRITTPLLEGEAEPPIKTPLWKLSLGGVLFGIGWGLTGYFPATALVSLGLFAPGAAIFLVAVLAGVLLHDIIATRGRLRSDG